MELTFAQQSTAFLYSILLGIAFGVIYSPLKAIRVILCKGKASVFVIDFLYAIFVCVTLFCFSLAFVQGYIRIYVLFGALFGFAIYTLTIGTLLFKIYFPIVKFTTIILQKIELKIKKNTKKLLKKVRDILYNTFNKKNDKVQNFENEMSENHSKFSEDVYNIKVMNNNEKGKSKIRKESKKS